MGGPVPARPPWSWGLGARLGPWPRLEPLVGRRVTPSYLQPPSAAAVCLPRCLSDRRVGTAPAPASSIMPGILSKCDKCGKDCEEGERNVQVYKATQTREAVYRHSDCNNFHSRCQAVFRQNEELRKRWQAQGAAARQEFCEKHHDLYGRELAVTLYESLELESEKRTRQGIKGEGKWLDEATIRDDFKNRPAQAEAILKNAQTFYHPTREVLLYQVFDYVSLHEDMEIDREVRKRKTESEVTHRPKAKAKAKPKAKAAEAVETLLDGAGDPAPPPAVQKPFSDAEKKKLEALVAKTDAALLSIAGALVAAGAAEMVGAVSPVMLKIVETSRDTLTVKKQELDAVKEAGAAEKGFLTKTAKEMKEPLQVAQDVVGRVNESVEFASMHLGGPAPPTAATEAAEDAGAQAAAAGGA